MGETGTWKTYATCCVSGEEIGGHPRDMQNAQMLPNEEHHNNFPITFLCQLLSPLNSLPCLCCRN